MTEVACHMVWVCHVLKVRLMTLITVREGQLVVAVDVARLALKRRMRPRKWESCRVVIKRCWRPRGGCVTGLAIMTEVACHMVRIGRALIVGLMALVTVRVRQLIVTISMTRLALNSRVRSGEREPRDAVIERRW
jgi:hypothetical protein